MAEEIYNKSINDSKLFKLPITVSNLKASSLGPDLARLNELIYKYDTHNEKTQSFFLNMIKYIKTNKLISQSEVMALLYGHISHYFLDVYIHPLIYYQEKKLQTKKTIISPHTLIEGYISAYLTTKILKKDYMDIKPNYLGTINFKNKNLINTLRETYYKTYQDPNIIPSYIIIFKSIKTLDYLIKNNPLIKKETLIKLTNFSKFLKANDLTKEKIVNSNQELWQNQWNNCQQKDTLIKLYQKAVQNTLETINIVNTYLYDDASLSTLTKTFTNLSYDTATKCSHIKILRPNYHK